MLALRLTLGLKSILKLTRLWLKLNIRLFFVDSVDGNDPEVEKSYDFHSNGKPKINCERNIIHNFCHVSLQAQSYYRCYRLQAQALYATD